MAAKRQAVTKSKTAEERLKQALDYRDEEWRDAILPNSSGTFAREMVASPQEAYLWLQARSETEYECVEYFEKRATKARLRRREAENNLLQVAIEWERMKQANCDVKFSRPMEALLLGALAKSRKSKTEQR